MDEERYRILTKARRARRLGSWVALLIFLAGLGTAIWYPTTTVRRLHEQCIPDPCIQVFGPVQDHHSGLRFLIGLSGFIVALAVLLVMRHRTEVNPFSPWNGTSSAPRNPGA